MKAPVALWAGRALLGALLTLVLVNLWWAVGSYRLARQSGRAAPDFVVRRIDAAAGNGDDFQLAAARGHPVLVDFWATYCIPCQESLPILNGVYRDLKQRGLRVIAIETEGAEAKARALVTRLRLDLPVALDPGDVAPRYGVTSIPYMVLIGGDGEIKRVFHGVHSAAEIRQAVEAAGLN